MPAARTRRQRTVPRLTRRGAALMVVGVVLVAVSLWFDLRDVLLLAFVALAMPLVALGYTALRLPRLAVTRSYAPPTATAGGSTRVRLVVQNRSRRTFDGASWRDELPTPLYGPSESVLPAIGPWERMLPNGDDSVTLEYLLRTPRRGVFPIGPLRIALGDPFGLARMERQIGSAREFVVTPRVTELDHLVATNASIDGALRGLQRHSHPNSDELIAREYRYGDPLRRINWPATARRGELMVREEEQRGDPEARLVLDTTLSGRPESWRTDETGNFEFELAVEIAASIGVHLLEHGFRLNGEPLVGREADPRAFGSIGEYRSPGGAPVLLDDLARIATPRGVHEPRVAPVATGPRGGVRARRSESGQAAFARGRETRVPGFVVLVQPDDEQIAALAAARRFFAPAMVVALPSVSETHIERLEHADWRVLRVRRAADLAAALQAKRRGETLSGTADPVAISGSDSAFGQAADSEPDRIEQLFGGEHDAH